jgi:hypothetical protein
MKPMNLLQYDSTAKIKEHEPTAVKRDMTEKITDKKRTSSNPEDAKEIEN